MIKTLLRRVFRVHTYLVYRRDCAATGLQPLDGEQPVVLSADNVEQHSAVCRVLKSLTSDADAYLDDIRKGRIVGLILLHGDDVVHHAYVFVRNKSACILGLGPDTALIGNDFTVPHYRGRGCQARSVAMRAAIAAERGFGFVVAETSPDNAASQRGLEKGGMTLLGRMDLAVVLNCIVIRWRRPPGFAALGFCLRG